MAYTKQVARHDKITIDGTDVSNSFREFGRPSEHSQEDASGFSASGADESLAGRTSQSFEGVAFYTEELALIVEPIHDSRAIVEITWQPNGLVDSTREVYVGNCQILTFSPRNTRGQVSTFDFSATAADENGITVSDWT
jgi:hypothetical protein